MQIKKNDTVVVIAGKDKGKTGTVLRVLPKKNKALTFRPSTQEQPEHPIPRLSTSRDQSMHPTLCSMTRKQRPEPELATRKRMERKYVTPRRPVTL